MALRRLPFVFARMAAAGGKSVPRHAAGARAHVSQAAAPPDRVWHARIARLHRRSSAGCRGEARLMEHALLSPADLIDLQRYPILDLNTEAARELTRDCREQLDRTGAYELPGFLTGEAVSKLTTEADRLSTLAYHSESTGTPYLEKPDPSLPENHPRRIFDHTSVGVVASDRFPADSMMRRLYEWAPLMDFIGAALNKERLYRYADPFGALNLAVMRDGERLHWHFDQTDFVTSIALRAAEQGGDFDYVPLIRSASDENYPRVQRLLLGAGDGVVGE